MFAGVHTALVTPFKKNRIDQAAFRRLIDFNFDHGVTGVVPCGTTGESPTLSHDEHHAVVELAVRFTKGRGPVIAGTGSNATDEAVSLTRAAEKAGADASLQVCPYYNKPSQEGLYQHFKAVARPPSSRSSCIAFPDGAESRSGSKRRRAWRPIAKTLSQ